jgi:16S rRNA processing protein RimM
VLTEPARIAVGRINGIYGVQGWVKIYSYTTPVDNILHYRPWQLYHKEQWQTVDFVTGKIQGKKLIAQLEGYTSRESALVLMGADIFVYREQLPPTQEGEYYWTDLIGLKVVNQQGIELGKVEYLFATGANDVLVVQGEIERLIPFDNTVLEVDFNQKILRVEWDADF